MLAGRLEDGRRSCLSHMFEAVGAYKAGRLDEEGVEDYENNACPTCGSCSGMLHRQLHELPHRGHRHGPAGQRHHPRRVVGPAAAGQARGHADHGAGEAGHQAPGHHDRGRLPQRRDGGHGPGLLHQHTMLHLPAIAHECGIELDLDMSNAISAKTPNLCHLAPAGDTFMEDLEGAGGVYAVMKELTKKGLLDTSVLTCTARPWRKTWRAWSTAPPRSSVLLTTPTPPTAASPCSRATWPPRAAW